MDQVSAGWFLLTFMIWIICVKLILFFQKKGKKKKDESEEGEISSNDEREEEFDDGLDEDLIGKQNYWS